ncbi:hypothetical protein CIT292_09715 [Citrobacter youngae ATCC 29220]|uniref:Uncharacterized protein n=1 Tax=Citrobacter youngae ATCC 29220 TaxID=500640 RepID=D4BGR5_9ENTR|nr:hypothetical protein CIT292_09715 [Citrobacter youngae ATCC 29220]
MRGVSIHFVLTHLLANIIFFYMLPVYKIVSEQNHQSVNINQIKCIHYSMGT